MTVLARTAEQVLGERVSYYRRRALMTQQDLADRVAERCGVTLSRVTIAKIEAGARSIPQRRTTMFDVLLLAVALDVSPPLLLVALDKDEDITVGHVRFDPVDFMGWWCGWTPRPANVTRLLSAHGRKVVSTP